MKCLKTVMLEAIMFGHDEIKKIVATIEAASALAGKPKMEVKLHAADAQVSADVRAFASTTSC